MQLVNILNHGTLLRTGEALIFVQVEHQIPILGIRVHLWVWGAPRGTGEEIPS